MASKPMDRPSLQRFLEQRVLGLGPTDTSLVKLIIRMGATIASKELSTRGSVLCVLDAATNSGHLYEREELARRLATFLAETEQEADCSPIAKSDMVSSDGTPFFSSCPSGTTPCAVVVPDDCLSS